jgi:hypothetical protein
MSDQPASRPGPAEPATKRNPVERTVVWGGIFVLLALAAFQARARLGYSTTLNKLQSVWETDSEDYNPLLVSEVSSHIYGWPNHTVMKVAEAVPDQWPWTAARGQALTSKTEALVYRWPGLSKSYSIALLYERPADGSSESPPIMSLLTEGVVDEPEPVVDPAASPETMTPMMTPGGGGPPGAHGAGGGPGGGGPGGQFNPLQYDADGDGKLSLEEAPDRMKENFATNDANSDGFLDEEELNALRERFRQQREEGGEEGSGRRRPPSEDPESEAKPDAPATDASKPEGDTPAEKPEKEAGDSKPEA